ncbi:MAG TPA: alpha/beta hydrolase [Puia sp.]|nr:alpha/beta hydrolase [Puia sp.]
MTHNTGLKIESGFAEINGASVYFEIAGQGKPIVFVHGLGLDCRMWDDQFFELSDHYRILRYDLRGFGRSSLPGKENYSHHGDLYALMQLLNISNACLVGLSMGGRVVVDFAITYPDSASSIVLVDSALNGYSFKSFSLAGVEGVAKVNGTANGNHAWLHHELFGAARRQPVVVDRLKEIISSYSGWHWINPNPWQPINPAAIHQLDKIHVRALIIVGEEDLPDFHDIADILRSRIAGSKKVVMKGVGHMSNMEDSTGFNHLLLEFLSV